MPRVNVMPPEEQPADAEQLSPAISVLVRNDFPDAR